MDLSIAISFLSFLCAGFRALFFNCFALFHLLDCRRTRMSSVVFQPLLHDPFGWKRPNTTYKDHFKRVQDLYAAKNKIISPYSQLSQRRLAKATADQSAVDLTRSAGRTEDEPRTARDALFKSASIAIDEPPVAMLSYRQRTPTSHRVSASITDDLVADREEYQVRSSLVFQEVGNYGSRTAVLTGGNSIARYSWRPLAFR